MNPAHKAQYVLTVLAVCAGAILTGPIAPALGLITPATVVAGPSPEILGVGNVAMAPDGTGGVVWRQLADGVPHVFVSQFSPGGWSGPIQVDTGQAGPATFPEIAAGDGGELLVVWVQPWASVSVAGKAPATVYQLQSSVMQPGAQGFGAPVQVDPADVGDGSGVYPSLAMAANGTAYVVYRVVTNPLTPGVAQPQGTITPMRPGDELVDVRVARFNGLSWSSLGAVNRLPGDVTSRKPTASNAPVVAVDLAGDGLVAWQEPGIDGVARIWARRLFGTTQGTVLEASPETISGQPVSVDADAPSASLNDSAGGAVAYRLDGGPGSPLSTPQVFVNTLASTQAASAAAFNGPLEIGGASTVGQPSVAVDDYGRLQVGFTAAGTTELAQGSDASTDPPQALGSSAGDPALTTLDPDGGGAAAWPSTDAVGEPVINVRQSFPHGGWQTASLSAPIAGPLSSLSFGPSGQGDALIAFQQGFSATTQVAVATVQAPPHAFSAVTSESWVRPTRAVVTWDPSPNAIGPVLYAVSVDGQTRASGLYGLRDRLDPRGLGSGVHHVRVIATDSAGEQTVSPVTVLKVDGTPPLVTVRILPRGRARVRVTDPNSGAAAASTQISFGDGSRAVRRRLTVVHRYVRAGHFRITVRCADNRGNHAVDHLLVRIR